MAQEEAFSGMETTSIDSSDAVRLKGQVPGIHHCVGSVTEASQRPSSRAVSGGRTASSQRETPSVPLHFLIERLAKIVFDFADEQLVCSSRATCNSNLLLQYLMGRCGGEVSGRRILISDHLYNPFTSSVPSRPPLTGRQYRSLHSLPSFFDKRSKPVH